MCARELIFDQLLVLFAHGASCEYLAEITQSRGNKHQRYAKVTQLYFDCVEEPDSTHCPAPFLVCHNTYLVENMCERTNGYHELSARKPCLSALRRNVTLKNATFTMESGPYACGNYSTSNAVCGPLQPASHPQVGCMHNPESLRPLIRGQEKL